MVSEPKLEDEIQQLVRLEASKHGIRLFRNNSGALKDETGRVVRFGLANESSRLSETFKSSDLIGIMPDGRFIAIECKKSNWNPNKNFDAREIAQKNFIDFIVVRGGIAGFANSVDAFLKIIGL